MRVMRGASDSQSQRRTLSLQKSCLTHIDDKADENHSGNLFVMECWPNQVHEICPCAYELAEFVICHCRLSLSPKTSKMTSICTSLHTFKVPKGVVRSVTI